MTDAATGRRSTVQSRCDTSGQTVPRRLEGDVPGGNGLIAFGLSPVAANEVTTLSTVQRRIVRKDIKRWWNATALRSDQRR
jgi:hypothetical protein